MKTRRLLTLKVKYLKNLVRAYGEVQEHNELKTNNGDVVMKSIPYKRQSLLITHPDVSKQWDKKKNRGCGPDEVFAESYKRIWWLCEKGHLAFEPVRKRTKRGGCSDCINNARKEVAMHSIEKRETFEDLQKNEFLRLKDFFSVCDVPDIAIKDLILKERGPNRARIYKVLRRYQINSFEALLNCTYDEISKYRDLGSKSQRELFNILTQQLSKFPPTSKAGG